MTTPTTKQVIVIRKDLKMNRGKEIAQGAHASINAILGSFKINDNTLITSISEDTKNWLTNNHYTKVTLQASSLEEIKLLEEAAKQANIPYSIATDLGLTYFKGQPTITCIAIGPADNKTINQITGHLKLY